MFQIKLGVGMSIKSLMFILILSNYTWASDLSEVIDCALDLESYTEQIANYSRQTLENSPDASFCKSYTAATWAGLSLAVWVGASLGVCLGTDSQSGCLATIFAGEFFCLGSCMVGTIIATKSRSGAEDIKKVKRVHARLAALIKDALEIEQGTLENSLIIKEYLAKYQSRSITDEHTVKILAQKIKLAAELGYFISLDSLSLFKDESLVPYSQFEDIPQIRTVLGQHALKMGSFLILEPQQVIEQLIKTPLDELVSSRELFRKDLDKWKTEVEVFVTKAKKQLEKRAS